MPAGTFVFVLSDFLALAAARALARALARAGTSIPVIVQDPVWEQSFPDIGGIVVPFVDPATGKTRYVELTRSRGAERRRENEERRPELLRELRGFDLDPVLVETSELRSVHAAFLAWADRRRSARGRSW